MMVILLLLLVAGTSLHYLGFDRSEVSEPLVALAKVTQRTGLSLAQAYYEPSVSGTNIAYPEMQGINRMDFVYVK